MVVSTLGGIGLFLLGMILLTDGLKALAGDALRVVLTRAVSNPWTGATWGALLTVLIQSSTATSLITIGLVSAGLLTFPQAIGVTIGAGIGTTATGWLVALVGVQFSVTAAALPVVAVGATMRLLGNGRWPALGLAFAGCGLLFVGLDYLAAGMAGLSERMNPADLPAAGPWLGRMILVALGVVMTLVMQSSTAASATTIAALHAGAVSLDQAAALVIGQNIGTTATGLLAMPGAPAPAKRTAIANLLFKLVTGVIIFAIMPPFLRAMEWAVGVVGLGEPVVALALFHTAFNVFGAVIFLPLTRPFATAVERLLPDRGLALASALDESVSHVPEVALEAARRAIARTAAEELALALDPVDPGARRASEVQGALDATRTFLTKLGSSAGFEHQQRRLVAALHALDHAERMADALREPGQAHRASMILDQDADAPPVRDALARLAAWMRNPGAPAPREQAASLSTAVATWRRARRVQTIESAAASADVQGALDRLDAIRWIDRVAYHAWRMVEHLAPPSQELPPSVAPALPPPPESRQPPAGVEPAPLPGR